MDFELWKMIPSLFHSSIAEKIPEFSKNLHFILSQEYYENFLSGMTRLI